MGMRKSNQGRTWPQTDATYDDSGTERRERYERPYNPVFDDKPQSAREEPPLHVQVWRNVQAELAMQLVPGAFLDWVWPLFCQEIKDDVLIVICPDKRRLEIAEYRKPLFLREMERLGMEGLGLEFRLAPGAKGK